MLDSRTFLPLPGSEMVSCKLLKPSFCYLQTQRTNTCLKSFCVDERHVKPTHIVWPRGMVVAWQCWVMAMTKNSLVSGLPWEDSACPTRRVRAAWSWRAWLWPRATSCPSVLPLPLFLWHRWLRQLLQLLPLVPWHLWGARHWSIKPNPNWKPSPLIILATSSPPPPHSLPLPAPIL